MSDPSPLRSAPGSDAFLAAIVEAADDAIISKDLDGIITTWNPAAERLFGYTAAETIGRPITMLFPPERYNEEPGILARIRAGERISHYETVRRHKDGSLIEISLTVSPIRDAQGKVIGASKIVRDLRTQKRLTERLEVTLASIGDAVITTDANCRIVFMNGVAEKLTAWDARDAVGQDLGLVFNIVNETTLRPVESPVTKALREGTVQGLANHTILVTKTGAQRPIDDSAAPIRSSTGQVLGVVLVFRDVTERRAAEIAAKRLSAIVEGSDDAIISKNLRSIITSWNPGAQRIFGYTADEMVGQSILLLIPPDRHHEETDIIERLGRGERVEHFETVRVRKDGSEINVSITVSPIHDDDGTVIGASKIARDITAQKNAERALRQAQAQLQAHSRNLEAQVLERTTRLHEMVAELDAFSYSLSHDLRAPLRAIQGFSEVVLTDFGDQVPDATPHLKRIISAAARMDRLIHDVLAFSRIARADIKVERVDLDALVQALVNERPHLQPPRARVTIVHPLADVLGHEASLTQCIANLLDNAVKFVAPGATPEVCVATETKDGNVKLTVTDNGIGIEATAQTRLFRMFERLPTQQPYEGTGIGLAIVRKAAERMNGHVGVESRPGHGSTFWLELDAPESA